jgi:cytochrome c peroxidase
MFEGRGSQGRLCTGLALGAVFLAGAGCSAMGEDVDGFSSEDWKLVQAIQPLATPMPRNPFNHRDTDVALAKLGQMWFFETDGSEAITVDGLSGKKGETGKVGCVTCHDPNHYFIDARGTALSHGLSVLKRNTPSMVNLGWYEWNGWAGRFDSLLMHGSAAFGGGASQLAAAHWIYKKYHAEWDAAFPDHPLDNALDPMAPDAGRFPKTGRPKAAGAPDGPWEMMTPEDQGIILQMQSDWARVWDAYPRALTTHGSAFERYVRGDYSALNPAAKRGLALFVGKAACNECHTGSLLSDSKFHNIGVPTVPGTAPDMARAADMAAFKTNIFSAEGVFPEGAPRAGQPVFDDIEAGKRKHATLDLSPTAMASMVGAFRTPQLLNIAETGPYFHTGTVNTLEEVVRHYNGGGGSAGSFPGPKDPRIVPLGLTDPEIADLVQFLKSLTGAPPDKEWTADIGKH